MLCDKIERIEGIEVKIFKLVGINEDRIYNLVSDLLINKDNYV